jgi:2-haloalkanoic acid dehalogenase type II
VSDILAVAFDCYGTLVDFGDDSFVRAYGTICEEQGMPYDGQVFFDKWMEVWRRLAAEGKTMGGNVDAGIAIRAGSAVANSPGPLSAAEPSVPHPAHHTPSAGRNRALDGPIDDYRPYREEWPEHFEICFEELGLPGDARRAHDRLVELIAGGQAFPEARRVVETISRRLPTALLSNADDDFLLPCLRRNALVFPVVVSSESAQAYKPHAAIFRDLATQVGLPLENILYVGDSRLADVIGAKHAGMQAAWVNRNDADGWKRPAEHEFDPDFEVSTLDGLLDVLGLR